MPGVDWSSKEVEAYQAKVVREYVSRISPHAYVFVRNGLPREAAEEYRADFAAGRLGWFHASSEAEPRAGSEWRYRRFYDDCRSGATVAYAEPWPSAWGHPDDSLALGTTGPADQRFGGWARQLTPNATMVLRPDPAFVRSLARRKATLRVVFLDSGNAAATIQCAGREFPLRAATTDRWRTAIFPVEVWEGDALRITAGDVPLTLHMVDLLRGDQSAEGMQRRQIVPPSMSSIGPLGNAGGRGAGPGCAVLHCLGRTRNCMWRAWDRGAPAPHLPPEAGCGASVQDTRMRG